MTGRAAPRSPAPAAGPPTVRQKPPEAVPARSEPPPTDQAAFIPDDVALGFEDLPADFWEVPAHEAHSALLEDPPPSPPRQASVQADAVPSPVQEAFAQLQSLFPGRVLEVRPAISETELELTDEDSAGDGLAAVDGYDDEDQDGLRFGPGDA